VRSLCETCASMREVTTPKGSRLHKTLHRHGGVAGHCQEDEP
jgi:hypothetical protein